MKRQLLFSGLILAAVCLALIGCAKSQARQRAETVTTAQHSIYKISGPYTHKNLSVFLIHGADQASGKAYLTLQEALQQKKVVVHETQNVNEPAIENVSADEVYVQAGDIVKGGQQDRVLSYDLIVPPHSGRLPLSAFCVEHGRWSQRGAEIATIFNLSENVLSSKDLKLAAKRSRSQQEVWRNVALAQDKLARNVKAPVAATASATSLQLTLENKEIKATTQEYLKQLSPLIEGRPDVIGYAFALNGQLNSADVYASSALFKKLWPKLLEASAVEAIAELDQNKPTKEVTAETVRATLQEAEQSMAADDKEVTKRVRLITRESGKYVFFETRDRQSGEAWVHRNYLTK